MSNTIQEYKTLIADYLRGVEGSMSHGDPEKMRRLEYTSEDDLLRKWFWIGGLGGAVLLSIIGLLFQLLEFVIPHLIMEILRIPLNAAWGVVLILLVLAIMLTVKK